METLWQDFVNSDWHDYRGTGQREDRLLKPGWLTQLLAHSGISALTPATEEDIATLQQLRTLFQRILHTLLRQQQPSEQDIEALNTYCKRVPSHLVLIQHDQYYSLQQVPYERNWSWILERITASFASMLVNADLSRIKQCENPDCHWIYYDESHNKSRRWCEETCANLMRVRHFRTRHRH